MLRIWLAGEAISICRGCLAEIVAVVETGRPIDFVQPPQGGE